MKIIRWQAFAAGPTYVRAFARMVGFTWPETPVPEGAVLVGGEVPSDEDLFY